MISSIWLKLQRRPQPPRQPHRLFRFSFRHLRDRDQRRVHHVDGKAHGMRELRVQQQKLRHPQRPQFRRVRLAIRLKGGAGLQQSHPLQIFFALDCLVQRVGTCFGNECRSAAPVHRSARQTVPAECIANPRHATWSNRSRPETDVLLPAPRGKTRMNAATRPRSPSCCSPADTDG